MSIVREIKRRNVFRMAVLYIVAAWLIMQVTEVLITLTNLPDWIGPTILGLLAVGFPIALILSWFYEITPAGISLEKDVDRAESITHITGRRLDFIVISMLVAAVILFAYDKWWIGGPPEKSIAVLPFTNMSDDPGQEYFSDGISEELLNLLAKIPELTVISRSSAFSFKDKNLTIPEIARRLNVAHVIEGSVRKAGNQVRITAQLIEAITDKRLWSETYDREIEDIFAIQDEIAAAIVVALKIALGTSEQVAMAHARKPTENLEAYELYLKGRYFWQRRGEDNIRHAIDLFEQATKVDPQFARAWSSLAAAHITLTAWSSVPLDEQSPLAVFAARKALMLDDSLAEAYAVLGDLTRVDRKWAEAEAYYLRAIASGPKNSTAHLWYGEHLVSVGRVHDALEKTLIAYQLDPLHAGTNNNLARIYWILDDTHNALKYGAAGAELAGTSAVGLNIQMLMNLRLGEFERAIEFAEQYEELADVPVGILTLFVEAKMDAAKKKPLLLEKLEENETILHFKHLLPAYVGFDRIDDAYRVANMYRDSDLTGTWWVLWYPEMAAFRQDSRFAELVSKLGLLDYWREYGWPDACRPVGDGLICE